MIKIRNIRLDGVDFDYDENRARPVLVVSDLSALSWDEENRPNVIDHTGMHTLGDIIIHSGLSTSLWRKIGKDIESQLEQLEKTVRSLRIEYERATKVVATIDQLPEED